MGTHRWGESDLKCAAVIAASGRASADTRAAKRALHLSHLASRLRASGAVLSGAAAHGLRCALGVVRLACVIASGRRVQAIAVEAGMLALRANHTELKHEDFVQVVAHTRDTTWRR
jgi:hypothetical protein